MAEILRMPKLSDTMTEGVIAVWHKKVGDSVKEGELLAEVDSDKATMEVEAYATGTVLYLGANAKEAVAVDGILAIVGKPGEDISGLLNGGAKPADTNPVVAAAPTKAAKSTTAVDTSDIKAKIMRMPKLSDTMTEGVIAAWHKKVGDAVKSGELLAEVDSDKATMEVESYESGTLLYIGANAKEAVVVDGILAIIGEPGADFQALINSNGATQAPISSSAAEVKTPVSVSTPAAAVTSGDERVKASPLAKKIAADKGIDLKLVHGSAEGGRIVKKDIEGFKPSASNATSAPSKETSKSTISAAAVGVESFDEVPVSSMRKVIAKRLGESLFTAPHFSLTMEINMDKAVENRKSMNEWAEAKISFNDMVIKAVAAAIRKNPKVNGSWLGDKIRYNHHIHIGVAVAVEEGLLVPVVRFADNKSLTQISAEVKDLGKKAKEGKLQPNDWAGNTFTISNLGMFGIEEFTSIINQPDVAILSVGAIIQKPIVKNGEIVIGNTMKVTLSLDHRVVDGAIGSQFLVTLKGLLEDPIRILA